MFYRWMNVVACVTDCRLTDVRMDVATADGEGALASSVEQCDCPVQYRGSSCERCAEGFYRSRQHGPYLGTCLPCQCHDRAATCDPHTGHCRVCNRHTHTHYLPAYLLTFDSSLSMVVVISVARLPTEHSLYTYHSRRQKLPPVWNSLSATIRQIVDSLGNLWKHIYPGPRNRSALWLLIIVCCTNTRTYLLTYTTHTSVWQTDRQTSWQHGPHSPPAPLAVSLCLVTLIVILQCFAASHSLANLSKSGLEWIHHSTKSTLKWYRIDCVLWSLKFSLFHFFGSVTNRRSHNSGNWSFEVQHISQKLCLVFLLYIK